MAVLSFASMPAVLTFNINVGLHSVNNSWVWNRDWNLTGISIDVNIGRLLIFPSINDSILNLEATSKGFCFFLLRQNRNCARECTVCRSRLSVKQTILTNPFLSSADKCFTVKMPLPGWTKTLSSHDKGSLPSCLYFLSSSQQFNSTLSSLWVPSAPFSN